MTTYTDEVNIYNPEAVGEGITGAAQTATSYITEVDGGGIKVHDANDSTDYVQITSSGMDVYNDGAKVARFGSGGAQIGRDDENHLVLGEDSLSMANQDRVTMFDVDMDAGVLDSYVTISAGVSPNKYYVTEIGTTTVPFTLTSPTLEAAAGETVTIPSGQALCEFWPSATRRNSSEQHIIILMKPTITATSGLTYTGTNTDANPYVFKNASEIVLTYGTASTTTMTAAGTFDETASGLGRVRYTFTLEISIVYDGGTTFNTSYTAEFSVSNLGTNNNTFELVTTENIRRPAFRYHKQTIGAALTFGTRDTAAGVGLLSATVGEGLSASQSHQTVLGRYNVEDTGNQFALIIGNGTADDAKSNAAAITWLGEYIAQGWAGVIQMFGGSTPPAGWLLCDGAAVSRTTYATLFAAIGTTWGAGDGSTTFNLPDLRGRAPIGAGTGSGLTARTLGGKLGSENIQAHTHSFTQPTITAKYKNDTTTSGSARRYVQDGTQSSTTLATASGGAVGAVSGVSTGNAGNMQPSAVVNFIIHTGKTS